MELYLIIVFTTGLCVGSFLNVVINRLPNNTSLIKTHSHCEACRKTLKWYDLIPIASYVALRGKCRYCHSPISIQYLVVEIVTAVLFMLAFRYVGIMNYELGIRNAIELVFILYIISSLIAIFFIDLKHGIIPDKIVFPAVVISFLFLILDSKFLILNFTLSAIGSFLFFLTLFLITKGKGMGFGDVKFAFFMGLFLGFPAVLGALYVAFLTGACVSLILIAWGKKKFFGSTIPFGPFLIFGTLVMLFFKNEILEKMHGVLRL